MRYYINATRCDDCGVCATMCPSGAIIPARTTISNASWWAIAAEQPYIVQELCDGCETRSCPMCVAVCDREAIIVNMLV